MFKDLIQKIAAELARNNIPYMIIGGQAVLRYGDPRLTKDIDITLGVGIEKLDIMKSLAEKLGLRLEVKDVDQFVKDTMVLPVVDVASGIRVDFVFSFSSFERGAIERAKVVRFDDIPVRFASLEDLVIHKMVAGRPRDIEDIRNMLFKNPGYDRDYIRNWLSDFDRSDSGDRLKRFDDIVKEIAQEASKALARLGGTAKELRPIRRRKGPDS